VTRRVRALVLGVGFLMLYGWFLAATEVSLGRLLRGVPWMADFLRRMFPPDLSFLESAAIGALQTLQIAVVGTTLAAVLALPLGFLSARNVSGGPVFYPARAILNFFRSIDTMVYALFFVAAVGLGPFPGVLAVVTYTTMTLAKLYSEAIEGIDPGPVEAIAATGAGRLQILRFGILPQVVPLFASYVLYRLETNIRAATILGFVGAGGIGFYIQTYLRMINYPAAAAVLLVLVAMIMGVDFASSRLRARIV
jgi:phosphonate transport system permease protein